MRLTFLGTGTSFGVPVIGCHCDTCTSDDPRDRRTRHAALIQTDRGGVVLVDTPPELRLQLVGAGVDRVDEVWMTHVHADHVHGLDDLRIFTTRERRDIVLHLAPEYIPDLTQRFRYIFDASILPPAGTTKPRIRLHPLPEDAVEIQGEVFHPIRVSHPPVSVYGFRVGNLGYITDAKTVDDRALARLDGVSILVLNALWFGDPHPTHLIVEEAVEVAERVGASVTYLTHLTHRVGHTELEERLPPHVRPAYDGLTIEVP